MTSVGVVPTEEGGKGSLLLSSYFLFLSVFFFLFLLERGRRAGLFCFIVIVMFHRSLPPTPGSNMKWKRKTGSTLFLVPFTFLSKRIQYFFVFREAIACFALSLSHMYVMLCPSVHDKSTDEPDLFGASRVDK